MRERENSSVHYKYRSDLADEDDDEEGYDAFGPVSFLAFNGERNMLAMYCYADLDGSIIILKDLS